MHQRNLRKEFGYGLKKSILQQKYILLHYHRSLQVQFHIYDEKMTPWRRAQNNSRNLKRIVQIHLEEEKVFEF